MPRLAFAGQHAYFHYTSLQEPAGGVEPRFFDWRAGADPEPLLADLQAFDPDVVFCWRPELFPPGVFDELDAITVGYLTEPLPRPDGIVHPDLETRLAYLREADPRNFDRVVAFNPHIVPAAEEVLPVWRSFPIPVADSYFLPVREARGRPRMVFTGRSTAHRESFLGPVKHDFDVVHLAHGVTDEQLIAFLREVDVGLNLHNEDYPQYENRVSAFLAAGLLVVTEPLSPAHGLRPGIDHVQVRAPWELWELATQIARTPDAFHATRVRGRRAAERFRASRVFPRFLDELAADVQTFGGRRPRRGLATVGRA
jgi:hypothetical protein